MREGMGVDDDTVDLGRQEVQRFSGDDTGYVLGCWVYSFWSLTLIVYIYFSFLANTSDCSLTLSSALNSSL